MSGTSNTFEYNIIIMPKIAQVNSLSAIEESSASHIRQQDREYELSLQRGK